jgi:DNA-directed RNA polymerase specialized sigma24 family protein
MHTENTNKKTAGVNPESLDRLADELEAIAGGLYDQAERLALEAASRRGRALALRDHLEAKKELGEDLAELIGRQGGVTLGQKRALAARYGWPIETIEHRIQAIERQAAAQARRERKCEALELAAAGWTDAQIAARFQVHRSTVSRWIKSAREATRRRRPRARP